MKLNRIFIPILVCSSLVVTTACEDMLDTTSDAYVFDEDHNLNSANDSLYSAIGIMTQMQKLGERYVVMGELRGDLVVVPTTADVNLQQMNSFNPLDDDSDYLSKRDYYSVINNCNIALARMDTTITEHGNQVMLPEYAAIRTMRDWTMLQAALTYGKVCYMTQPVLSIEDTEKSYSEISLDELVGKLITDLEPLAARYTPNYGVIDGKQSSQFFMRPALLLADLYLYNGNYEQAAAMYYKVIDEGSYIMSVNNANKWTTSVRTEAEVNFNKTYTTEVVTEIPYASDPKKYHPNLVNVTYNTMPQFMPAQWWINEMNTSMHFHIDRLGITNISGYLEGDLRGMMIDRDGNTAASSIGYAQSSLTRDALVMKYFINGEENTSVSNPGNPLLAETGAVLTRDVVLYRIPHLYLRYAEAVNRAGKPTLAFATLKYGLRGEILDDETKVDPEELADAVAWTNFADAKFNENYGSVMRGRGLGIAVEQTNYVIPEGLTKEEAIDWVEDRILDEMAAETSFEGNRFFDLLRISHHRPNHPAYMASKIARRFDTPAQIESKLSNVENLWVR